MPREPVTREVLRADELALRWGVSEKTLERWRNEGRGPKYMKLGSRIGYPLAAVFEFERAAGRISTSERDE
ncbi:hypothetical protein AAW51_3960 [Caldimonas brevitalea]|uniref:Helix-turn-helix domain-containing protein n=1 Tax=Caldimonas brevitalea TaxID=413882 RepID=A0A0G3BTD9_9BURK|nr:hypothetical protein AAW51_3960 [Caldimonas brevitalea]